MSKKKNFYAVKKGHKTEIFSKWSECSAQIHGFKGAMYKGFETLQEAEEYMAKQEVISSERHSNEEEVFKKLGDKEMIAYVDGSNLGDGSMFSWGVVAFGKYGEDEKKFEFSGKSVDERFTPYRNVAGELFASVNAVKYAIKIGMTKISIYHDYSGIRHWALGEWQTKNELSQHYANYMNLAKDFIKIEFVKAEGHTGDRFNEEVDKLAKRELGIIK